MKTTNPEQYCVTRIIYGSDINKGKFDKVKELALRCGNLRQDLWNKYGSLQAWGVRRNAIAKEFNKTNPPSKYGLLYKTWERTVHAVIDDIHASIEAAKSYVIKKIYRRYFNDEKTIKYLIKKLKGKEWLEDYWLHQLVRKQYHRGHTWVKNQIVYDISDCGIERKGNITWLSIPSLEKNKRLHLRFKGGKNKISGRIRLIIVDDNIQLHFPKYRPVDNNDNEEILGVDKGYTEVFYGSDGKVYGEGLGLLLSSETEANNKKGQQRNKLYSIAKKKKNNQIITQNLGKKKKKRRLNSKRSQIKSIVGNAVNQIFDNYGVLVSEDLSSPIKSKKKAKSVNRKLNNWTKGIIAEMVDNASTRRRSANILVNCAYTSQVDHRNGTLLGRRCGDQFFTFDGEVYQADWNASVNIKNRMNDCDINRYQKYTEVHQVLLSRTEAFLATMGLTMKDAVNRGWLDQKHLRKEKVVKKRSTG